MLRIFATTCLIGAIACIAFFYSVPTLVESKCREQLITYLAQPQSWRNLSLLSASFTSLEVGNLLFGGRGPTPLTVKISQPTLLFTRESTLAGGEFATFQASADAFLISSSSTDPSGGILRGGKINISPVAHSTRERQLSEEQAISYDNVPVLALDTVVVPLPNARAKPRESLNLGFDILMRAIEEGGTPHAITVTGGLSIPLIGETVPLIVKGKKNLFRLSLGREKLSSLKIRDPLSSAEIDAFELSPLTFCYVILLRTAAEQYAHQLVANTLKPAQSSLSPSELAVRYAVYGYFLSRIFGPESARLIADLFSSGRELLPSVGENEQDSSLRARASELFSVGFTISEEVQSTPRDLSRLLTKERILMGKV